MDDDGLASDSVDSLTTFVSPLPPARSQPDADREALALLPTWSGRPRATT